VPADHPDDDARIDELYGLPVGDFVAAREALARELRSAGRKDAAAAVHSLRRPTIVPWSINQVARTHADQVADLVAATASTPISVPPAVGAARSSISSRTPPPP
jgi:hypothetical protein